MRHNIVTGTVTRRQDERPINWRRFAKRTAITVAVIFTLFLAFGLTLSALAGTLVPS